MTFSVYKSAKNGKIIMQGAHQEEGNNSHTLLLGMKIGTFWSTIWQ